MQQKQLFLQLFYFIFQKLFSLGRDIKKFALLRGRVSHRFEICGCELILVFEMGIFLFNHFDLTTTKLRCLRIVVSCRRVIVCYRVPAQCVLAPLILLVSALSRVLLLRPSR